MTMTNLFSKLTMSTLAALLGLAATGCDQHDADAPTDRDAQVLMQLDGKLVQTWEVAEPGQMQADLIVWGVVAPSPDACEDGEVELDLVLEQDGEALASFEGCAAAEPVDAQSIDGLTAKPDTQGTFWCNNCAQTNDCYACCKCDGGSTAACSHSCFP